MMSTNKRSNEFGDTTIFAKFLSSRYTPLETKTIIAAVPEKKPTKRASKMNVTFSELVTINTLKQNQEEAPHKDDVLHTKTSSVPIDIFPSNISPTTASSFKKHVRQIEVKKLDTVPDEDNATITNIEGKVPHERRVHQRTAILAILSYQQRIQEQFLKNGHHATKNSNSSVPVLPPPSSTLSNKPQLLLSQVSTKFSQRAKDIALESARLNCLEVYSSDSFPMPSSISLASLSIPVALSDFPIIKQKKRDCETLSNDVAAAVKDAAKKSTHGNGSTQVSLDNVPLSKRRRNNAAA